MMRYATAVRWACLELPDNGCDGFIKDDSITLARSVDRFGSVALTTLNDNERIEYRALASRWIAAIQFDPCCFRAAPAGQATRRTETLARIVEQWAAMLGVLA